MEEILQEKLNYEFETFICNLRLCSKDNIIARSSEIELKRNILHSMAAIHIPEELAWRLMAEENVLELLYRQIKEDRNQKDLKYCIWKHLEEIGGKEQSGMERGKAGIFLREAERANGQVIRNEPMTEEWFKQEFGIVEEPGMTDEDDYDGEEEVRKCQLMKS